MSISLTHRSRCTEAREKGGGRRGAGKEGSAKAGWGQRCFPRKEMA